MKIRFEGSGIYKTGKEEEEEEDNTCQVKGVGKWKREKEKGKRKIGDNMDGGLALTNESSLKDLLSPPLFLSCSITNSEKRSYIFVWSSTEKARKATEKKNMKKEKLKSNKWQKWIREVQWSLFYL